MTEIILAIVTAIVGSEALVRLVIFFVERKNGRGNRTMKTGVPSWN